MRNFSRVLVAGATLLVVTGCPTGPSAGRFVNGTTGGAIAYLKVDGGSEEGELLEVQDTALVLAAGCGMRVIPFRTIRNAKFRGIDTGYRTRIPSDSARAQMTLVSRFPAGMPAAVRESMAQCSTSPPGAGGQGLSATSNAHAGMHHGVVVPDDTHGAEVFLATARASTARFQQLDTAISAGYRRIGGDLPSLGEHWIHPATVMSGIVDPARPSVLIYARAATGPVLAGVAWTTVLHAGDPYPEPPAGAAAWHEHNGTVAEETLPLNHHAGVASSEPTRVAILHAWIWIENPRGVWIADNWALPFVRAGFRPDSAPAAAARALSLTAPGGEAYYERLVAAVTGSDSQALVRTRAAIASSANEASLVRRSAAEALTAAELAQLASIWNGMWTTLAAADSLDAAAPMVRLAAAMR